MEDVTYDVTVRFKHDDQPALTEEDIEKAIQTTALQLGIEIDHVEVDRY